MICTKTIMLVLLVTLAWPGVAIAHGEVEPEQVEITGEIVDLGCFLAHGARGADHVPCAKRCIKGGQPMALLAEDGTVHVLYANHINGSAFELAKELVGKVVELKGVPSDRAGQKGIEVRRVSRKQKRRPWGRP